jgi:predicted porin
MQKKIIALAVAGLASTAAFAQSNVTVYGVVDAGYVYTSGNLANGDKAKANAIESGILAGSRIGFKGEEALGNGLKAVFTLEYGLGIDGNNGIGGTTGAAVGGTNGSVLSAAAARQQFVGLAGGFGTVTLGRQYAPGYAAIVRNDAIIGSVVSSAAILTAAGGNSIAPNSAARWNNAVAYSTNDYSGFSAKAIYGFGQTQEVTTPNINDPRWGLGANYAAGAFNADFVYQSTEATTGAKKNEYYLGGSYDAKVVKVLGSYQKLDNTSAANVDNKIWQLGLIAPVGKGAIHATYGQLDWQGNVAGNNKSKSYTVAYSHGLSKRTTLYTAWNRTDNNNNAANAGVVTAVAQAGKTNDTFGAGINHSF